MKGKKTGGRKKGTKNKIQPPERSLIAERNDINRLFDLIEEIEKTDILKAAELRIKVLPYMLARLKEVEFKGDSDLPISIELVRHAE